MSESSKQNYKDYYDIDNDPIGNGAYGFVYKGKEKKSKELRAIKKNRFKFNKRRSFI